jgi:hypothetical protein
MWRAVHRYQEWAEFADLALPLISCATSETDAERVWSMEQNVARLHGTRFSLPTTDARLRAYRAGFSPAGTSHIDSLFAGCGDDDIVIADHGSSNDESSEVRDDLEAEDS